MKKVFAILVSLTFVFTPAVTADSWLEKRHKEHVKTLDKVLPDLVVVGGHNHRYYDGVGIRGVEIIHYPRGDWKGRDRFDRVCPVRIDQYGRAHCPKHNRYDDRWGYSMFPSWHGHRDHGGCFVRRHRFGQEWRWRCEAHDSYSCPILLAPPYIRGGSLYFDPSVKYEDNDWDEEDYEDYLDDLRDVQEVQARRQPTWDVEVPAQRQLLQGPHGSKQPDGTDPWCFWHYRSDCVIIEGPLNGRPVQIKGQMEGLDGQMHSYYCPLGGNCKLP